VGVVFSSFVLVDCYFLLLAVDRYHSNARFHMIYARIVDALVIPVQCPKKRTTFCEKSSSCVLPFGVCVFQIFVFSQSDRLIDYPFLQEID